MCVCIYIYSHAATARGVNRKVIGYFNWKAGILLVFLWMVHILLILSVTTQIKCPTNNHKSFFQFHHQPQLCQTVLLFSHLIIWRFQVFLTKAALSSSSGTQSKGPRHKTDTGIRGSISEHLLYNLRSLAPSLPLLCNLKLAVMGIRADFNPSCVGAQRAGQTGGNWSAL